jgi:hypothetical protein
MISVPANARFETVVLLGEACKFTLLVLRNTSLLVDDVSKLVVLCLQHLTLAIQFRHHDCIGRIDRGLLKALHRRYCSRAPPFFSFLQNVDLAVSHGHFNFKAATGFLALRNSHVVLKLVVSGREPDIS